MNAIQIIKPTEVKNNIGMEGLNYVTHCILVKNDYNYAFLTFEPGDNAGTKSIREYINNNKDDLQYIIYAGSYDTKKTGDMN